jgi:stringent starvation protein A
MSEPTLLLYDHPVSSYAQKIRIALREKSLPFKSIVPTDLTSSNPGSLHASNPRAEVPVLIHKDTSTGDDISLFDSTIIMEYLEDRFPETSLMPTSAAERAKQRHVEEVCDTHYEAVNWGVSEMRAFGRAEGELKEIMEANAKHHIKVIQGWLEEKLGDAPLFAGERFGWADCCAAPIVNRSVAAGNGPEEGSKLQLWHKRIQERESVKETFKEFEDGVVKMPLMKDAFITGQRKREYRDHRLEWMIKAGGIEIVRKGMEVPNIRFSWPDNPQ